MRRELINRYLAGGPELADSIVGLSEDDLSAFPVPGTWNIRQIVIHMMDSDLIGSDRMKRIATMELPLLVGYDETAFSQLKAYESIPIQTAVDIFVQNRQLTAAVLRELPEAAFQRTGIHTEKGKITLESTVADYAKHWDGHRAFIQKKRALLGK